MPTLHFKTQGHGPRVVLSHALGCDLTMWDSLAALLQDDFTILRYDHRGHGQSPAAPGSWTIDDLADDAAELIRAQAGGQPVHFVGLSMGGMTAQSLGARHPELVRSLAVANSASYYDAAARAMWQGRIDTVRSRGVAAIADGALQRWFTPGFLADARQAAQIAGLRAVLEATDAESYAAASHAVAHIDLDAGNARIACPTLVIAGSRDEATPPALSERIAAGIAGAHLRSIDAAHLSVMEEPQAFAKLLREFWSGLPG